MPSIESWSFKLFINKLFYILIWSETVLSKSQIKIMKKKMKIKSNIYIFIPKLSILVGEC